MRHAPLPSRRGISAAAFAVPRRLECIVAGWRPDAIVPLDDMSSGLLRDLAGRARTSPDLRCILATSLGGTSRRWWRIIAD